MGFQQTQSYCNRCDQPTLHTRNAYQVPHLLHLLFTLFFCGFWLPVWILHTLVNSVSASEPYRCTQCGQAAGQLTPQQSAAEVAQRAYKSHQRRESVGRAATASANVAAAGVGGLWHQFQALAGEVKKLPGRTDHALRFLAGEGNGFTTASEENTPAYLAWVMGRRGLTGE